ncbi:MAG TPA: R3H domain-containing nucleic acid-binding protein [Candidatus Paceibacterota bacterium]|jgi:spoIIIJ-associated protein|nr:R3H domain-containing nucleic acid-binding protein [Candidatus Paceibacterota bacterium]
MDKEQIQNLIQELIGKITLGTNKITVSGDEASNTWYSVEVGAPHSFSFLKNEGEAIAALNHLVRRIIEAKTPTPPEFQRGQRGVSILIDINDFQKKKVESVRAIAHMMGERARYFKSNIEVDPMSAFERRVVHEFLSDAADLETESTGYGPTRRVVIKYTGN